MRCGIQRFIKAIISDNISLPPNGEAAMERFDTSHTSTRTVSLGGLYILLAADFVPVSDSQHAL
jgi:hypothetical protein